MAKLTVDVPTDLINQLERYGRMKEIAPKMIDAATPIAADAVRKRVMSHRQTGALANSIAVQKAKENKKYGGYSGKVYFKGYDKETGVANAQKAMSLEYGSSKQDATPFITAAMNDCESECIDKMQEVFTREVEK